MLLMTKLKNALKKELPDAIFNLANIQINSVKKGCSGFITHKDVTVYVNTEESVFRNGLMYRYARDNKDYHGFQNQWVYGKNREIEYIKAVVKALKDESQYQKQYEKSIML